MKIKIKSAAPPLSASLLLRTDLQPPNALTKAPATLGDFPKFFLHTSYYPAVFVCLH